MNYAESLKTLLDGWWGTATMMLGLVALATLLYAPNSCGTDPTCSGCPWDRGPKRRRRYWAWRVWRAHLWVVWDLLLLTACAGRVVTDLVLGEVAWTLPLFAAFGAWLGREWLRDLRDLERSRAKRDEVRAP